jgi:hypothetical protein
MAQLTAQTKIGLTFSQILSLITTAAIVVGFYYSLNIRIAKLEQSSEIQSNEIIQINKQFERYQNENRQDHIKVSDKLDLLLMRTNAGK